MPAPKRVWIILAFAGIYIIWGSTYLAILFAIQSIPPFLMAGARFFIAGAIMYAIGRWRGDSSPERSTWWPSLIIGACLLLGGNGGVTISERWVPTGLAALLVATVPIYIALLGWISGTAPRPTPLVWLGLLGGFAGVAILLGPTVAGIGHAGHPELTIPSTAFRSSNHLGLGMAILLFGSLVWSVGSLYSRRAKTSPSLFLAAGQQMMCGGALLVMLGLVLGEFQNFSLARITPLSIGAFIYLVLIGALIGYTAYFYLLRVCDPAKVATYAYVNPVVAIVLGTLFAGERFTLRTLAGAGLILVSVAIVITAQQLGAKAAPPVSVAVEPDCVT